MKIISQENITQAADILKNGGLVAFPTETVFGLGVVFDNKKSYDRLVSVKKRPPEKPFTIMCADPEDVAKYAEINEVCKKLISKFMPGQFTLLTKAKTGLDPWCISSEGIVGVRVPDLNVVRDMIRLIGKPLLVPSANRSGEAPCNNHQEIIRTFEGEIDAVVIGESNSKTPSTIVLVSEDDVKIIREGVITLEQIKEAIK